MPHVVVTRLFSMHAWRNWLLSRLINNARCTRPRCCEQDRRCKSTAFYLQIRITGRQRIMQRTGSMRQDCASQFTWHPRRFWTTTPCAHRNNVLRNNVATARKTSAARTNARDGCVCWTARYAILYRSRRLEVQQCVANQATARCLLCRRSLTDVVRASTTSASRQTPAKYGVGTSEKRQYVDVALNRCRCLRSRARLPYDSAVLTGVWHTQQRVVDVHFRRRKQCWP